MIAFGLSLPDSESKSVNDNVKNEVVVDTVSKIRKATSKDYINHFKNAWDSVKLTKYDGLPEYEKYHSKLDSIITSIASVNNVDNSTASALRKLRLKFLSSIKFKSSTHDYLTYGQPGFDGELFAPCMTALHEILTDPNSVDILKRSIKGQSKKGWIVLIIYRAKNSFGARVLQSTKFDVRYSVEDNGYYVANFNY